MPRLTQIMVRAALLWQALGFSVGALVLATKGGQAPDWLFGLREAHIHMLLAGWLVQLTAGMAYWILPRHDAAGDRGDPRPLVAACAALNLAALLALAHGLLAAARLPLPAPVGLLPLAGEAAAFLLLAAHTWGRALPFRTLPRPAHSPK
jgi:hypothetical protein